MNKHTNAVRLGIIITLAAAIFTCTPHALAEQSAAEISTVKQVGAYLSWNNALAKSDEINKSGKHAYIMEKNIKGKVFFVVLEGSRQLKSSNKPPKYGDMGYIQVGAFLDRVKAEDLIKDLSSQGVITFHCMKKIDGKVYFRVYKKTGEVRVSPCTTRPYEMDAPAEAMITTAPDEEDTGMSNALAADEQAAIDNSPSTIVPIPDETEGTADTGSEIAASEATGDTLEGEDLAEDETVSDDMELTEEELAEADIANSAASEELAEDEIAQDDSTDAISNSTDGEEYVEMPEQDEAQTEVSGTMQEMLADTTPVTTLAEKPPLYEAPEIVVLDTSMVRRLDDNINFMVKPDAVVFADRNQFGTWYGTFKQFSGGRMVGQSNKWYAIELIGGKRGYVFKADTVEYNIPTPEELEQQ